MSPIPIGLDSLGGSGTALGPRSSHKKARLSAVVTVEGWEQIRKRMKLSPRELEIARCIMDGFSEVETASHLEISKHTVHSHIERMYKKLDVNSQCGLVARMFATYASQRGAAERDLSAVTSRRVDG